MTTCDDVVYFLELIVYLLLKMKIHCLMIISLFCDWLMYCRDCLHY